MSSILAWIFLLIALPFAFMSVLFASRRLFMILWNFVWYFVLAKLGEAAFGSIEGQFVGVFFATLYTLRLILAPRLARPHVVMKVGNFGQFRRPASPPPPERGDVIDVEYTKSPDLHP